MRKLAAVCAYAAAVFAVCGAAHTPLAWAQLRRTPPKTRPPEPPKPEAPGPVTRQDELLVVAPIHSSALSAKITMKTPWPRDRDEPRVVGKAFHVAWEGRTHTPKGHAFPSLLATLEIAVPAGAQLTAESDRPLQPQRQKTPATDIDLFTVHLAVTRMESNTADFHVRFAGGRVAEFTIEYGVALDETIHATHETCAQYGIKVEEKSEGKLSAFFFARCRVEDGVLYVNILKPIDRLFVLAETSRQLLETSGQPVVRVALPQNRVVDRAVVAEMRLSDEAKSRFERYEVVYQPPGGPPRWSGSVGLSPGYIGYRESFAQLSIGEAVVTGKLTLGYKIIRGVLDAGFNIFTTLIPVILRPNDRPPARWIGINYRLGYVLPIDAGVTTFSLLTGWYQWMMVVPANQYGIKAIAGPQIFVQMSHRPLGSLGWSAYFKFAPMGDGLEGLEFSKLGRREVAVGFSHDLNWFGELRRRPSLTVDVAQMDVQIRNVAVSQTSLSLGLAYPLF